MKCTLCDRQGSGDLCRFHNEARDKLQTAFKAWENAYGGLEWKVFLENVKLNQQTGRWAREVALYMEKSA
jgi:hypothetical protein